MDVIFGCCEYRPVFWYFLFINCSWFLRSTKCIIVHAFFKKKKNLCCYTKLQKFRTVIQFDNAKVLKKLFYGFNCFFRFRHVGCTVGVSNHTPYWPFTFYSSLQMRNHWTFSFLIYKFLKLTLLHFSNNTVHIFSIKTTNGSNFSIAFFL